eukprot:6193184-Pleurochrysis_carterae.AAC.2
MTCLSRLLSRLVHVGAILQYEILTRCGPVGCACAGERARRLQLRTSAPERRACFKVRALLVRVVGSASDASCGVLDAALSQ